MGFTRILVTQKSLGELDSGFLLNDLNLYSKSNIIKVLEPLLPSQICAITAAELPK